MDEAEPDLEDGGSLAKNARDFASRLRRREVGSRLRKRFVPNIHIKRVDKTWHIAISLKGSSLVSERIRRQQVSRSPGFTGIPERRRSGGELIGSLTKWLNVPVVR